MTTRKLHYFDFRKDARATGVSAMAPVRALPASWYTSEDIAVEEGDFPDRLEAYAARWVNFETKRSSFINVSKAENDVT
ncbi:hypothetical protein BDV41DRAFT_573160 [Aspergillus transmontanensis]|uniref:Uncharacterized protein n=1 Tax=Aspergillus transmontanensis TaxID=1034304 RepID=A0A5N6W866_9EURO|nr:hypothetical protein BDV41DRAFT_573160 [Aspergillus transmontanensis]